MTVGDQVLEEFGQSLGIEGMSWPPQGGVSLQFEERGVLWLESHDEAMFVCLVRDFAPGDDAEPILRKALAACHYRQGLPYVVQPGLRGKTSLGFVVRLAADEITLPALESVLGLLTDLQESVRG